MKLYKVSDLATKNNGEYVLGSQELHAHACYLVYGILKSGEEGRIIKPGGGHEEIVCIVHGETILRRDLESIALKRGDAFYIKGEDMYFMDNSGNSEVIYIIAGGHSERHEH
ncbi:MAG: hypothetical protein HY755_06530 [Nitrospirae bacterium]|nr:hypothetical protein [Nitrospirota bacterium]